MRTIKELLILVRDELNRANYSGLCDVVSGAWFRYIISDKERNVLRGYIELNEVKSRWSNTQYWFPPYEKPPRIEWLDKHINLN